MNISAVDRKIGIKLSFAEDAERRREKDRPRLDSGRGKGSRVGRP